MGKKRPGEALCHELLSCAWNLAGTAAANLQHSIALLNVEVQIVGTVPGIMNLGEIYLILCHERMEFFCGDRIRKGTSMVLLQDSPHRIQLTLNGFAKYLCAAQFIALIAGLEVHPPLLLVIAGPENCFRHQLHLWSNRLRKLLVQQ